MRARAILILLTASLLWGSGWIFTPLLAQAAGSYASGASMLGSAALLLFPFAVKGRLAVPMRPTVLLSVTMFVAPSVLLTVAGRHGISGWVPLLYAAMPLLLGLARGRWAPAQVGAVGAVLVLLHGTVPFAPGKLRWVLPAFAAVAFQAWSLVFVARRMRGLAPRPVLGSLSVQCALAAAMLAGCSLLLDPVPRLAPWAQWTALSRAALPVLALGAAALPYGAVYGLLAAGELEPRQVAVGQWWQTLVMVGESAFFAHARPSPVLLLAAAALVGCSVAELRPEPVPEPGLTFRGT